MKCTVINPNKYFNSFYIEPLGVTIFGELKSYDNIQCRNNDPIPPKLAYVRDATDDPTVTHGGALYLYNSTDKKWSKFYELECMDQTGGSGGIITTVNWADIVDKPTVFPAESHHHSLLDIIGFSELDTLVTAHVTNTDIHFSNLQEKEQIGINAGNITEIQQRVNTNDSNISELQQQTNNNAANITTLQQQVSSNTSDISGLQRQITSNTENINNLQQQIDDHQSDVLCHISNADRDVLTSAATLTTTVEAHSSMLAEQSIAISAINDELFGVAEAITVINSQLGDEP